jgi:hypothetical protein
VDPTTLTVIRYEAGKRTNFIYNYKEVVSGKNLEQFIELNPGDVVTVPEPD